MNNSPVKKGSSRSGKSKNVSAVMSPVRTQKNKPKTITRANILRAPDLKYRSLFENMLNGFAYCRMIFEQGQPLDFIYLDVNTAFESLTGLKDVVGKKVTEIIPGLRESDPGLFEIYGRVALSGKPERFETYVEALKMWFLISVYSPRKNYFVAIFDVITERKTSEEALRTSLNDYRHLFNNINDVILIMEPEHEIILEANEAAFSKYGFGRDQLIGMSLKKLTRNVNAGEAHIRAMVENGSASNFESVHINRDGVEIYFLINCSTVEYQGRKAVLSINHDITERKLVEAALRESEVRYRGLFEDSPIALWEEDFSAVKGRLDALREQGIMDFRKYFASHPQFVKECAALVRFLGVNKAAIKLLGADNKEELFDHLEDRLKNERNEEFQEELINITEGKTSFGWEGNNRRLDGQLINIDLNWTAAPGYERSLARVFVSMMDITERRLADEKLQKILSTALDGYYLVDMEGRILDANDSYCSMIGYSREELLKMSIKDIEAQETEDVIKKRIQRISEKGSDRFETRHKCKDGNVILIEASVNYLKDGSGKLAVFMHDITERKQSEERIQRQLQYLAALREIDRVIASSFDLHYNLDWILKAVTRELGVDAGDVLLFNPVTSRLDHGGEVGFRTKTPEKENLQPHSFAMRVVLDRQPVHIPDLNIQPNDLLSTGVFAREKFVGYFGLPLMAKGNIEGVLEIFHRTSLDPDQDWIDFLNTIAGQAALAIDNANLFNNLQRSNMDLMLAYDATIEGWSQAMDLRDKETEGHTLRVTEITLELAALFGLNDEDLLGIRRGALLHDIGKMGVPDDILLKPDKLTVEEWVIMKKHPSLAFRMLSPIRYLQSAIDIPYCHHEKWDGSGYPRGLKGEQIPLAARIFSVVDVWDALTSDRPYRQAWSHEKALEYIRSESGKQFDPSVLKICLEAGLFDRAR